MDLIPVPSSAVRRPDEDFPLDDATTLTAPPGLADAERWLRTALSAATGLPLGPGRRARASNWSRTTRWPPRRTGSRCAPATP